MRKAKLCYIDTERFIVHVKTEDISNNIAENVETRFDVSNFKLDRPFPNLKNKKVIGLMKNELVENHERICWIKSKRI